MATKVTIIGGGSSSFVPLLVRRLMQSPVLGSSQVTLMDVDEGRLGVMQSLADKLIANEQSELRVTSTTDQRASLAGADFVIAAISVGPGGIMRAFRNAPVLADVARNAAEVAPDAWVFNYTNPAPIEALAMRAAAPQVRSYALCSCTGHPSSREWLAHQAGVDPGRIAMPPVVAGINHCASIQQLRLTDGTDAMPLVHERATEPIVKWVLDRYGVLPYCWSHWTEFFPQMQRLEAPYAGTAQGVSMRYGITTHDMAYERSRVRGLEQLAETWTAEGAAPVTLADLPKGDEDEGIEVIDLIEAIVDNGNITLVVNAPNEGTISNLPDSAIVEVNAQINAYGIRPIQTGPLPETLAAHLRRFFDFQQQVVLAALSGDREQALHAFMLDPNTASRLDLDQTRTMMDELLEANAQHLPLFA